METTEKTSISAEDQEKYYKLGHILTVQACMEGLPSANKFQKDILPVIKDKTGFTEEEILELYQFLFSKSLELATPKRRVVTGFKQPEKNPPK